jgi:hypothetical protein
MIGTPGRLSIAQLNAPAPQGTPLNRLNPQQATLAFQTGTLPGQEMGYTPGGMVQDEGGSAQWGERFNVQEFGRGRGFSAFTPTGTEMATGSRQGWADFVEREYGLTEEDFLSRSEQERMKAFQEQRGAAQGLEDVPVDEMGNPLRAPRTPQEAALFQMKSAQVTRGLNEQLMKNAAGTMQYAFGMLRRGGEGSLAAFMQPALTNLSQIYNQSRYETPDYSYFLTPEAYGGARGT